jgi:hypothetical protein
MDDAPAFIRVVTEASHEAASAPTADGTAETQFDCLIEGGPRRVCQGMGLQRRNPILDLSEPVRVLRPMLADDFVSGAKRYKNAT